MRFFVMWLFGLVVGVPIGVILRTIYVRPPKRQCKFVREIKYGISANFERCSGVEGTSCVEHLCPSHCREIHGEKCVQQLFAEVKA